MSKTKVISFLSIVFFVTVLAQNAKALPTSTYGENNGWSGQRHYAGESFDCWVAWTVYDVEKYPTEFDWAGAVSFPSGDRYIYAYQLFNVGGDDIGYFEVLDLQGNPIAQESMNATHSQWDGFGEDVMPDPNVSGSGSQGVWKWTATGGFVSSGDRSSYLIFSSPYAPTRGSFKIDAPEESDPIVPDDSEIPEPATIALIGVGSGWFIATRNKKRRAS